MPKRVVNSVGSAPCAVIFVSLTMTAAFGSSAQAEGACIENPPEPAAEGMRRTVDYSYGVCSACHFRATEILLWSVHYDRANGRKCWFLVDAYGRDVTQAHMRQAPAQPQTQTVWSRFTSLFSNFSFTGVSAHVPPESGTWPSGSSPDSPRKRQSGAPYEKKADNGVHVGQRSNSEGRAAPRAPQVSTEKDERALFTEFMRWRESQQSKTMNSSASTQR